VVVTVSMKVPQPVWQVGQAPGPVTVTVGVTGQSLLLHGTVMVSFLRIIQSG